ncbi:MAG TPA: hypothetical protein PLR86_05305, partial [Planctomycetota bacterium]|nr:hypothetical protein [Planctomycetota bacterium]
GHDQCAEGAGDGRRPESVEFCDEKEDSMRRDFTINGLFLDPIDNKIIDYVHGQEDIQKRLLRTIGDANERFAEDHLRMMRAIRFAAQLDFTIEETTWETIVALSKNIVKISKERIREEFCNMLLSKNPARAIFLLQKSGLLHYIFPKIQDLPYFQHALNMLEKGAPFSHFEDALCVFLYPVYKTFTKTKPKQPHQLYETNISTLSHWFPNLCWAKKTVDKIHSFMQYFTNFSYITSMNEAEIKRLIRLPYFTSFLNIYYLKSQEIIHDFTFYNFWHQKFSIYTEQDLWPVPLITGQDLVELGFQPSPIFKIILDHIETEQLLLHIHTKQDAIEFIHSKKALFCERERIANSRK